MKNKRVMTFFLLSIFILTVTFSGCTVTFTSSDSLQFNFSKPSVETESLLTEFELGESASDGGDVTQKAGSACVGGACIVY